MNEAVYIYAQDMPWSRSLTLAPISDRDNNRDQALNCAGRLYKREKVPIVIARNDYGYFAVGKIGTIDSKEFPYCVGVVDGSVFLSALNIKEGGVPCF
jgi:hypothetical protein